MPPPLCHPLPRLRFPVPGPQRSLPGLRIAPHCVRALPAPPCCAKPFSSPPFPLLSGHLLILLGKREALWPAVAAPPCVFPRRPRPSSGVFPGLLPPAGRLRPGGLHVCLGSPWAERFPFLPGPTLSTATSAQICQREGEGIPQLPW